MGISLPIADRQVAATIRPGEVPPELVTPFARGQSAELAGRVAELERLNAEIHDARIAALNLMEDAIASREALQTNEERMRGQKEAFQAAINGATLAESLGILSRLVSAEMRGEARNAFYVADLDSACLHPVLGAGTMPEAYLKEVDGFLIGRDSLACGLAIPMGRAVITPDILEDPRWKPWMQLAQKFDYRGCWSFPIKTRENQAMGTFAMYFSGPREPKPQELALADVVTQAAAVIISRHAEVQQRGRAEAALRASEGKLAQDLVHAKQLQAMSSMLVEQDDPDALYRHLVEAAKTLMQSDAASLQMLDPEKQELRLIAWNGFHPKSAKFWERVSATSACSCGIALQGGERQTVEDVFAAPGLKNSPSLEHYRLSRISAVQTTPLVSRSGRIVGMISTHWHRPHRPGERDLALIDVLARQAADVLERITGQAALRQSEARLQRAISIETVGVLFFRLDGAILDANTALQRMTGYDVQALREMGSFEQLTAPLFVEVTRRTAQRLARTGEAPPYEKQMVRPDGSHWWGLVAPTRLRGSGRQSECVEFIVEISHQKAAEEELRESEERYRSIVNQNLAGILQIDLQGQVLVANQQFCVALDRSLEELRRLKLRDLVHPEDLPAGMALLKKMARDGKPFEIEQRLRRADGTFFWAHNAITPIATAHGGKVQVATIVSLNIAARREVEAQLRANEEQFRRAIEDAPIPVIMHAEDGQVLQISKTWTKLTGYTPADIPTFDAWLNHAYGPGADKVREHVRSLFRGRVAQLGFEMDVKTRAGQQRRWSFSASAPGTLRDGRRYIVGMAVDITERAEELRTANAGLRELSRRLVSAQETERRNIAEMLHDDIGQVLTCLNLTLKRAGAQAKVKEIADAEVLVSDLLKRVRGLSMDLRPHVLDNLGLAVALRWQTKKFTEQTKIPVTLTVRGIPRDINGDVATTVFRTVQEALTNVARHSGSGRAWVNVTKRAKALQIEIRDTGRGFDPDKVPKTTAGLANLRERVRLNGGEFAIESRPNRGTTIRATLPAR